MMSEIQLEQGQKRQSESEFASKSKTSSRPGSQGPKDFLPHIHAFRALAIVYILAGHSIDFFKWQAKDQFTEALLRSIFSNGSVLFVFIAGYLFQHLLGKYSPKKYLLSKIKTVATPYIFISIPAIILFTFYMQRESIWTGFYDQSIPTQMAIFILTGKHLTPFWFVPMILIFYLMAPFFALADRSKYVYFLLPLFLTVSFFVNRGTAFHNPIHFFSVYLLGMFTSHYKHTIEPWLSKPSSLLALFVIAASLLILETQNAIGLSGGLNFLQKTVLSLFFVGFLYKYQQKMPSAPIYLVGNLSFGIFFIHAYVLTAGKLLSSHLTGSYLSGNVFLFGIATVLVLLICAVLVQGTKIILGNRSRYFIGC